MPGPGPRPAHSRPASGRRARLGGSLPDFLFTGPLVLLLLALECATRLWTRSDAEESFALVGLLLLVDLVRRRHRRDPLPWVTGLAVLRRRLTRSLRRQSVTVGIDLRRAPPVEGGFPPILAASVAVLCAVPLLLAAFPGLDLMAVREGVRALSAVLWLAVMGAAWALFAGGGFYLLFITFALTHDELVRSHTGPGPRPTGWETLAFSAWPALILLAWFLLPAWAPAAILVACMATGVATLSLPGAPVVPLLWKRRGGRSPLRSIPWCTHTLAGTAAVGLLLLDALLLVKGRALWGGSEERLLAVLPFSAFLVSIFAWTGTAALVAWTHFVVRTALLARFRDPSRPFPTTVFLQDPLPPAEKRRVEESLGRAGLRTRFFPAGRGPAEVAVSLAAAPVDPFALPVPGGPLPVPPADLDSAETLRRILRRGEILHRRLLLRGLEKLFKKAAARRFEQGHGFWVAPWHWFCIGLSRDEDERAMDWKEGTFFLETVGPSYHRVFPREVLRHAFEVMRGLEVDLLFVEDGVGFRRLRRVLRRAFELHDKSGGRGRAEEHHFTGLPGVRVMIHAFDMEEPFRARKGGYPEPDYESVGRARILHVFRDREESEETADAPRDRQGVPVLC